MTDYNLTLSTTEANSVGVVKLRHADTNSQVLKVQVIENGLKKSFKGLTPFFCLMAREVTGQGVSEEAVKVFDSENGTLEYTSSDNALQMIGRNEAYFSFRKQSGDTWIEQFSTRSFHYIVEKSIYSQPFKDSNYWWTFKELYNKFLFYMETSQGAWEDFVNDNKEILESIDPGGKILAELRLEKDNIEKGSIAFKKMNTSPSSALGNDLTICTYGNSLTAGNGATPGLGWPERMKILLDRYSREGQNITLMNRSVGGYTAKMILDKFPEPSLADLAIIAVGTNDYDHVRPMEEYIAALDTLITRELAKGTAVVLCTAPQWGSKDWLVKPSNGALEDFNAVTLGLGKKYNIPVLDLYKETRNLNWTALKTGEAVPHIHLSDIGYQMWAHKIVAFIGFQHPETIRKIKSGDFLGVRLGVDGVKPMWLDENNKYYYLSESAEYPTPAETTAEKGLAIHAENEERVFHYAVNIDEDNLMLFPNFKLINETGTITFQINGQNNPFLYSNPFLFYDALNRNTANHSITLNRTTHPSDVNQWSTQNIYASSKYTKSLPFAAKGFYILTVKATNVDFFGFDCISGAISKLLLRTEVQDTGWIPLELAEDVSNTSPNYPSAYRKIVDQTGSKIKIRLNIKGNITNTFATLPSGFYQYNNVLRLAAADGTLPSLLVVGGSGALVVSSNTKNDFKAEVEFYL